MSSTQPPRLIDASRPGCGRPEGATADRLYRSAQGNQAQSGTSRALAGGNQLQDFIRKLRRHRWLRCPVLGPTALLSGMTAERTLQPAGMRNYRTSADGLANRRVRPNGDIRADAATVRSNTISEHSVSRANSCSPPEKRRFLASSGRVLSKQANQGAHLPMPYAT